MLIYSYVIEVDNVTQLKYFELFYIILLKTIDNTIVIWDNIHSKEYKKSIPKKEVNKF